MGLKSQLGGNTKVTYARGYYVSPKEESEESWQEKSTDENLDQDAVLAERKKVSEEVLQKREELRKEAVALAREAKEVILVVGLNHDYDVEGFDRDNMELPYDQDQLIEEVLAVNPDTVIVMMAGNAVSMGKWKDKAKAIVWQWYCGMEAGNVLTDVLFGRVNPSGKLPESMPYCMEDCGAVALGEYPGRPLTEEEKKHMNAHTTMTYHDGIYVGYRYYEKYNVPVQFCFGHGLSYTTFDYSDVKAYTLAAKGRSEKSDPLDEVTVITEVTVTNTGDRTGKEIVQVYVGMKDSKIDRAVKELRGFDKVELAPQESKVVQIPLTRRAFTYYDVKEKAFVVEPGEYQIYIAKSLQDVQDTVTVTMK